MNEGDYGDYMNNIEYVENHIFLNSADPLLEIQTHATQQNLQNINAVTMNEYNTASTHPQSNAGDQFRRRSHAHFTEQSRYIGMFESSIRTTVKNDTNVTVSRVIATPVQQQQHKSFIELDSHADTTCAGANCRIIAYTVKVCSVSPYHPKYKALENVHIVQAGTAYDDQNTDKTCILIMNQSLYMGDALPTTLLNLNQARSNNIQVDDVPWQFGGSHSIFIPHQNLRIPLILKGVFSCLPVRLPTAEEIKTCEWIELTSAEEWNPKSDALEECEKVHQDEQLLPICVKNRTINPIITTPSQLSPYYAEAAELSCSICSAQSSSRRSNNNDALALAKQRGIGLETATKTLNATTQLVIRQAIHPIQRCFHTEVMQLRYPRPGGRHGCFYTDTFFAKTPSLGGSKMAQVYINNVHFTKIIPMKTKAEAPGTHVQFMQDIGIPSHLHSDDAKELTQGRMGDIVHKCWIKATQSEPYSPWQVQAELCNRELKKAVRLAMAKTKAPDRLWDFCATYHSEIRNFTAHPLFNLHGRTPYEVVTGQTPDISEYTEYAWYDTIWYYDQEVAFPDDKRKLAKWLGVAHRVGQALCYYMLPERGCVIVRSTVQSLSQDDKQSEIVQRTIQQLNDQIESKIVDVKQPNVL
jgi:hypothetical protein